MEKYLPVTGRILLALIFVMGGLGKLGAGYAGTQGYMDAMGVPGILLPLVILLEIGGGIALIIGWKTRIASLLLAGFTIIAALIFHHDFANQVAMIMFMKNLAISGGLLILASHGAGAYSLDNHNK